MRKTNSMTVEIWGSMLELEGGYQSGMTALELYLSMPSILFKAGSRNSSHRSSTLANPL
ncbi:MAG: hypothetical protein OFPII_05830 [Osedax symbiont Rs1]|nr:MAG: hypothetical protein OFPII_05830 [Osedax symbiont Rs1]